MTTPGQPLRALLVEDSEDDAKLVLRQLRTSGFDVTFERVETAETMRAALERQTWDVILSDYQMPHFNGLGALAVLRVSGQDLPFIVVSGTIGEAVAVGAMKAGAHDYLMKDSLARLVPAIQRELREADQRRQRRKAEETLRQNEKRFRGFFEASNVGLSLTQGSGRIQANRALGAMVGYSPEELSQLTWQAVSHPDDIPATQAEIDAMISGKMPATRLIKRYIHKNGSVVWADLSTTLQRDDAGQPAYFITAVVDITERKQLEATDAFLSQAGSNPEGEPFFAALARFLADHLRMDYICIDRLEGDALSATTLAVWHNGQFEDNVTYALKDTPCGEVVDKRVCCYPAHVIQSFPRDPALQQLQAESYIGTTLFDHRGNPIGLIAVIGRHPLTNRALAEATLKRVASRAAGELERLMIEAELRRSEERYRLLVNTSPEAIVLHQAGRLSYVNAAAVRMLGATKAEDLIGLPIMERVHPDFRPFVAQRVQQAVSGTVLLPAAEEKLLRLDGTAIDVEITGGSLVLGGVPAVQLIIRDIQERKQALETNRKYTEELRSRNAALARFNEAAVGRELRMVELKREVNRLCSKLGQPDRFKVPGSEAPK